MRDAFVEVLTEAAARNPRVMLVTGDLGFGVLTGFEEKFPRQFINAGVAEQNMTAIACGLALEGRKVFTYSIANFGTLRCLEQLRNDVCYHGADVTAVAVGGGFSYGQLGMSHFATEDLAIMRALPGMRVIAPASKWEAAEATKAILAEGGPCYLRLDKGDSASGPERGGAFVIGKARALRDGRDITLIACGAVLAEALAAADGLARTGIAARVISMPTVKPLDTDAVRAAARETGGIVTIEEHNVLGGLGAAVAETCLESGDVPRLFLRLGIPDIFPTIVGDQNYLREHVGLSASAIAERVERAMRGRGGTRRPAVP